MQVLKDSVKIKLSLDEKNLYCLIYIFTELWNSILLFSLFINTDAFSRNTNLTLHYDNLTGERQFDELFHSNGPSLMTKIRTGTKNLNVYITVYGKLISGLYPYISSITPLPPSNPLGFMIVRSSPNLPYLRMLSYKFQLSRQIAFEENIFKIFFLRPM